jgi:predicted dehydrogenase
MKEVAGLMYNVLFAGCGRISDLHALGYTGFGQARIYGVFDTDRARAAEKAGRWGADKVYGSYTEALADPAVDIVEILTPHHLHCAMAVEAAGAGKHVSVQKPMALSMAEADLICGSARQAGVLLRVYENFVYYPPYVKARQLIEAGEIGDPLSFNLRVRCGTSPGAWDVPGETWAWRFAPETGGGCPIMFDHGYHNFSLALYMLGGVEKVTAWAGCTEVIPGSGLSVSAPAAVIWQYRRSGAIGLMDVVLAPELQIGTRHYPDESRLEITGTRGVIFVNRCTGRLQNRPPVEMYRDGVTTVYEDIPAGWEHSFILATRDFVEALAEGRQPMLSGEEGRSVLELTLAVQEAIRSGQPVYLGEPESLL